MTLIDVGISVAMFSIAFVIQYAHVRGTQAITSKRKWCAANWGALTYALGVMSWLVAFKVGFSYLVFEGLGYYVSTLIALRDNADPQV